MDMAVPKQVQDQLSAAEAVRAQLYDPAPAKSEHTEPAPTPEPVVEPVAAAPAEVVTPKPPEPDAKEEQRYRTLQAKYDKEVPRLYQQVRERDTTIQELTSRLEKVESQQKDAVAQKETTATASKDVEEFGADLVDMVRRTATAEVKAALGAFAAELDKRLKAVFGEVGEINKRVAENEFSKFWDRVSQRVPDWDSVDNDPSWREFLDTTPEYTTETYRELAGRAIAAGDADKIAALVKIWRGDTQRAQAPVVPQKDSKAELQRQVAPSTTRAATPPQGPKTWSMAEYEYVFSRKAELEIPAKKLAEMQADAQSALAEGRVSW